MVTRRCKRCFHVWVGRKEMTIQCPKCRSPYWDKERTNEAGSNRQRQPSTDGVPTICGEQGGARPTPVLIKDASEVPSHISVQIERMGIPERDSGRSVVDLGGSRKFPIPNCPRCKRTLTDRGEWFTCDNSQCAFKRVAEEEVEAQYENRGQ